MTCPSNSVACNTVSNKVLSTSPAPHPQTGLAVVNVNNAQDWRVYYYDTANFVSELVGNTSGFDTGTPIGGGALNGSSLAAFNANSTTQDINVFYVDNLSQNLFGTRFGGTWTVRK